MIDQLNEAADFLRSRGITEVHTAVVLGTGLGKLIDHVKVLDNISYEEIPHFPPATVETHKGRLVYAEAGANRVLIYQGRYHYYEGYNMQQVVFPVRVAKLLGAAALLLSNAAGGVNTQFKKGDLVLIDDHINLQPHNPLTGKNIDLLGPRFPDMSAPYDKNLSELLLKQAVALNCSLKKGAYAAVSGPNLETRAEYRFLRTIGADMVGMSTVPEVIAANHMGMPCAAVSVITDECDPDKLHPVNIQQIVAAAAEADEQLSLIFSSFLRRK